MFNPARFRVLIAGILSLPLAAFLGLSTYRSLTQASTNLNEDFVFRLVAVTVAMTLPFFLTLVLAWADRRAGVFRLSGKIGLAIAVLSLGLAFLPLRGLVGRVRQAENLASQGVAAPSFETTDLDGKLHRLADYKGKVILLNAWATWCPPCKKEMPELDRLYQKRKESGLMVFGLSVEDVELQRKFVKEEVSVSYPLLTASGNVPSLYRDIQRWPALFLIDRNGELQPVPQTGVPFEQIEAAVEAVLGSE